jgi:very-short-patch-repair endonuclease
VSAPGKHHHRGVRVHHTATLTGLDVTRQLEIPVTTPARTVLDLAPRLEDPALKRLINDARLSGFLQPNDLQELIDRSTGQKGIKRLRRSAGLDRRPTRSPLEDRFEAFCNRYGLPRPEINVQIAGHEVDALFREQRVVVELDGREYHDDPDSFERDRDKDADLTMAGFTPVRITDLRLTARPAREAERLLKILDASSQGTIRLKAPRAATT